MGRASAIRFSIREMRDDDARPFLEVHHAAVRGIAARDYPTDVIDAWAPLPITERMVARILANPDEEVRLVAESDSTVVGIAALVPAANELRACYVAPQAARQGVGRSLMREIEAVAARLGLACLRADASLTAEPFYLALGYRAEERGQHILGSGKPMACVKMTKRLTTP